MTRPVVTEQLAKRLAMIAAEILHAEDDKHASRQVVINAHSRLDGACEVLDALGYAMTPLAIRMAVMKTAIEWNKHEPVPGANTKKRASWQWQLALKIQMALTKVAT